MATPKPIVCQWQVKYQELCEWAIKALPRHSTAADCDRDMCGCFWKNADDLIDWAGDLLSEMEDDS